MNEAGKTMAGLYTIRRTEATYLNLGEHGGCVGREQDFDIEQCVTDYVEEAMGCR